MYVYTESGFIKFTIIDYLDQLEVMHNPCSLFIHSYNRYNHDRNIQQAK